MKELPEILPLKSVTLDTSVFCSMNISLLLSSLLFSSISFHSVLVRLWPSQRYFILLYFCHSVLSSCSCIFLSSFPVIYFYPSAILFSLYSSATLYSCCRCLSCPSVILFFCHSTILASNSIFLSYCLPVILSFCFRLLPSSFPCKKQVYCICCLPWNIHATISCFLVVLL